MHSFSQMTRKQIVQVFRSEAQQQDPTRARFCALLCSSRARGVGVKRTGAQPIKDEFLVFDHFSGIHDIHLSGLCHDSHSGVSGHSLALLAV